MRATPAANISTALRNLLLWPLLAFAVGLADQFADAVRRTSPRQPDPSAGKSESSNSRWTAAAGLAVVGAAGLLAAPPAIEEGMNAFLPGYPQDAALRQDLPAEFHDKTLQLSTPPIGPAKQRCSNHLQLPVFRARLVLACALFKRPQTPAHVTLLAIIVAAQLPLLFFLNTGRYGLIAWPCTLLGAVLVLQAAAAAAIAYSRKWRSTRAAPTR